MLHCRDDASREDRTRTFRGSPTEACARRSRRGLTRRVLSHDVQVSASPPPPPQRDAFEGRGPQRRSQKRFDRRLEDVAEVVWGQLLSVINALRLALAVRETMARRRLGAREGGGGDLPSNAPPPPPRPPASAASYFFDDLKAEGHHLLALHSPQAGPTGRHTVWPNPTNSALMGRQYSKGSQASRATRLCSGVWHFLGSVQPSRPEMRCTCTSTPMPSVRPHPTWMNRWAIFGPTPGSRRRLGMSQGGSPLCSVFRICVVFLMYSTFETTTGRHRDQLPPPPPHVSSEQSSPQKIRSEWKCALDQAFVGRGGGRG